MGENMEGMSRQLLSLRAGEVRDTGYRLKIKSGGCCESLWCVSSSRMSSPDPHTLEIGISSLMGCSGLLLEALRCGVCNTEGRTVTGFLPGSLEGAGGCNKALELQGTGVFSGASVGVTAAIVKRTRNSVLLWDPSPHKVTIPTPGCPTLSYACASALADFNQHPCSLTSLWPHHVPSLLMTVSSLTISANTKWSFSDVLPMAVSSQ